MLHPLLLAGAVVAQTLPSVSTDATIVSTAIASGNEQIIGVTPYYWGANPTSQETYTVADGTALTFKYSADHNVYQISSLANWDACVFLDGAELSSEGQGGGDTSASDYSSEVVNQFSAVVSGPATYYIACSLEDHCTSNRVKIQVTVLAPGATAATPSPPAPADDAGDSPCFDRASTTLCRRIDDSATTTAAFEDCFRSGNHAAAERVAMTEARAGDVVLSSTSSFSRVVINQHLAGGPISELLSLHHAAGSIAVTPDHALLLNGAFQSAHLAVAGSTLSSGSVDRVVRSRGGVINPITVAGTVLAAGREGDPILAATHPEWAAQWFLASAIPFPLSCCSLLSYLFPTATQAFYDATFEGVRLVPALKAVVEGVPSPLLLLLLLIADIVVAGAGVAFSIAVNLKIAVALAGVAVALLLASLGRVGKAVSV